MSSQPPQEPPEGSERPPPGQQPAWGTPPPHMPRSDQDSTAHRIGYRLGQGLVIAVLAGVGLLIVLALIGVVFGDDPSKNNAQTAATTAPTTVATTAAPSTTGEPTTTDEPTTTAKPKPIPSETILRNAVVKALGESNRDVKRLPGFTANEGEYIVLTWRINENLTEGLTKDSARLDGMKILKAIRGVPEHDRYKGVSLKGTYSLVDRLGNAAEETVIRANYERSTLEKINFDGIDYKVIFDVADSGSTHPAFQY